MMRLLRTIATAALLAAAPALMRGQSCPSGWAKVSATAIQSIGRTTTGPNLLAYGSFTITAQTANKQGGSFSLPGGGVSTSPSFAVPIVGGTIAKMLCVPKSTSASPAIGYDIVVRDTSAQGGNGTVVHLAGVVINQDDWSFDSYVIPGTALTTAAFTFTHASGPPAGSCAAPAQYLDDVALNLWFCRAGVWVLAAQTGGGIANVTGAQGNGFAVSVANGNTSPQVSVATDSTHFLPINTGSSTSCLSAAGTYVACGGTSTPFLTTAGSSIPVAGSCSASAVAVVDAGGASATCRQLTADDLAPAFAITGFGCDKCGTYELGYAVASPVTFTASYSSAPTNASLSDGTHTQALSSPYTSGTLAYSYTSAVPAAQTFTLTATGATTKGAQQSISWQPRTFGGVGAADATGATASGTSAVLTGATGTLPQLGFAVENGTFTFNPSSQYIYLLLTGSAHTFKVNGFSATFSRTPVSFVNANGTPVAMSLYASPTYYVNPTTVEVN